jgi:hypothetical protein
MIAIASFCLAASTAAGNSLALRGSSGGDQAYHTGELNLPAAEIGRKLNDFHFGGNFGGDDHLTTARYIGGTIGQTTVEGHGNKIYRSGRKLSALGEACGGFFWYKGICNCGDKCENHICVADSSCDSSCERNCNMAKGPGGTNPFDTAYNPPSWGGRKLGYVDQMWNSRYGNCAPWCFGKRNIGSSCSGC